MNTTRLPIEIFRCVVTHTPLVSIDLILIHDNEILLGRRINEPAKGYWFTTGGRIRKNEPLHTAMTRLAKEELGFKALPSKPKFLGVFEHFYATGTFPGITTHYVNLAYILECKEKPSPPKTQHSEYRWFTKKELLENPEVHEYVKIYFKNKEVNG